MRGYEIVLITGKTINELEEKVNAQANIREQEINENIRNGYDVIDYQEYWFKLAGSIRKEGDFWIVPMLREKP